jgi:5,10-methylenetetrahydromethanopterin reductase
MSVPAREDLAGAKGFDVGVVLQAVDQPDAFGKMVTEVERLGYSYLWLTDSSLHARNCYSYLTLAAARSGRLLLGTAVTNPASRHPAITAAAAATVDEISGGRMLLGIGAGDRPLLALGFRPSRLADLEAAITGIRRLWRGETVDLQAPGFRLDGAHLRFPARPAIPVYLSASGPKTLELAGRVADGVILLVGLFPKALDWAIAQVQRGADQAGRPRPHIAVFAYGAIDEDEDAALDGARSIAAWFPQTAPHVCDLAGLPRDIADRVRTGYSGGEFQEAASAASLLPEWFVRQVALSGNRQRAAQQIRNVVAAGADSVHVFPLGADRLGTIRAFSGSWMDVVGRPPGSGAPAPGREAEGSSS